MVAPLRIEIVSDMLAMSLPVTGEDSSALPGGVTSPGRAFPGVPNGIMFFMKLHRFLAGFRVESLAMVPFGMEVLGVVV